MTMMTWRSRQKQSNVIYDLNQLTSAGVLYLQVSEDKERNPVAVKFSVEGTDTSLALWCRITSELISTLLECGTPVEKIIALLAASCYTRNELMDSPITGVIQILSRYLRLKQEAKELKNSTGRRLLHRPFEFFRDDYADDE